MSNPRVVSSTLLPLENLTSTRCASLPTFHASQADATSLFKHFADAGYAILYKDAINTVFLHKECRCVGGD